MTPSMPVVWHYETAGLAQADRYDMIRTSLSEMAVPVQVEGARCVDIQACLSSATFGAFTVAVLQSRSDHPLQLHRTESLIRRSDPGAFRLVMCLKGQVSIEQCGRTAILTSGDIGIYDTSHKFLVGQNANRQPTHLVMVTFPRSGLSVPSARIQPLIGSRFSRRQRMGSTAGWLLRPFAVHLDTFDRLPSCMVSKAVRSLADGLIMEHLRLGVPHDATDRVRMLLVEEHIGRNLRSPDLGPATIAKAVHLSVGALHALVGRQTLAEPEQRERGTTLMELVRNRRLDLAERELTDTHLSVGKIALQCGYRSQAQLSRHYRDAKGVPPSYMRPSPDRRRKYHKI
jgi:AraC-like DNA-binding protein